jgi:hypothetical protein
VNFVLLSFFRFLSFSLTQYCRVPRSFCTCFHDFNSILKISITPVTVSKLFMLLEVSLPNFMKTSSYLATLPKTSYFVTGLDRD